MMEVCPYTTTTIQEPGHRATVLDLSSTFDELDLSIVVNRLCFQDTDVS